jgi:hypothetical protein
LMARAARRTPHQIGEPGTVFWDLFSSHCVRIFLSPLPRPVVPAPEALNSTESSPRALQTQAPRNFGALPCLLLQLFISMVIGIEIYNLPIYYLLATSNLHAATLQLHPVCSPYPYVMTLLLPTMESGAYRSHAVDV